MYDDVNIWPLTLQPSVTAGRMTWTAVTALSQPHRCAWHRIRITRHHTIHGDARYQGPMSPMDERSCSSMLSVVTGWRRLRKKQRERQRERERERERDG